jgi:DNA-binding GntR family transcriptional regulator
VDELTDGGREATPVVPGVGRLARTGPRGQQVVEALRNEIIAGHFAPGQRLIEATLSRELGTSRGPVREALRQLENEGLVVSVPYKGAVVLGVSDEEVQEVLIPIRLVLERYSFSRAIEVMTDADFAELAKQIWVMERAARASDLVKVVEADLRFHDIVISSAGQPHSAQIWRSIWPRIRAYFFRYGRSASLELMADEHRELLDVLQTRDKGKVLGQLERHIVVRTPPPDDVQAERPGTDEGAAQARPQR